MFELCLQVPSCLCGGHHKRLHGVMDGSTTEFSGRFLFIANQAFYSLDWFKRKPWIFPWNIGGSCRISNWPLKRCKCRPLQLTGGLDGGLGCHSGLQWERIRSRLTEIWVSYGGWLRNPAPPKGWLKAYKQWDKPSINWCRISSTVGFDSHGCHKTLVFAELLFGGVEFNGCYHVLSIFKPEMK